LGGPCAWSRVLDCSLNRVWVLHVRGNFTPVRSCSFPYSLTLPYIFWNYWFAYGSIPRDKSSTTDDKTNDGPTKPELQPAWLRATVSAMTVGVFGGVAVAAYMQRTRAVTRLILLPPLPSTTSKAAWGLEGHRLFVQLLHHRGQQGFIQPLAQCKLLGTGEPSFMRDSSFDLQLDSAAEPFAVGLSGVSIDGEAYSELDARDELLRRLGSDRSTPSKALNPAAKRRPSAMWVKGSGPVAR
jgi:hypothetical protein